MTGEHANRALETEDIATRHLQFGWWCLLCFLTLGIVLEAMHGFKIGWYLDVGNDTRQMMGRLSHAHGTLLSIVNIAFAFTLQSTGNRLANAIRVASPCLLSATILMPLGFLTGGIIIHGGDPGLGILLVPLGGVLLLLSVLSIAWGLTREEGARTPAGTPPSDAKQKRNRNR